MIILKQIFEKRDVENWTGLKHIRIGFNGRKYLNTVAY
jgi:hypothetical protein